MLWRVGRQSAPPLLPSSQDAWRMAGLVSQASARSLTGTSRARLRQTTVPNAGAGRRPDSILRSVSGEMPAARATSTRPRSARAALRATPRRRPAAICSAVMGWRTMPAG